MPAPGYAQDEVRKLARALAQVARCTDNLIMWVDKRNDGAGMDFACDLKLDNPYEFDLDATLAALDLAADARWEAENRWEG